MLAVGDRFPAWEFLDHDKKKVSSADLEGKAYLLWYYPAASTPGCTMEGQGLRDAYPQFAEKNVEILGISFDAPEDNARFVEEQKFPYRLLSDDGTLALKVGAATKSGQGYARRISYLVGPDGKVLQAYDSVRPSGHAVEVLGDIPAP